MKTKLGSKFNSGGVAPITSPEHLRHFGPSDGDPASDSDYEGEFD